MRMLVTITPLATGLLDWLSGLGNKDASWSDPKAMLGWRSPLPAWAWASIILAAVLLSLWSYHRLLGARAMRMGLAVLRGLILLAVVALLAGPMLVIPREKVDPDWLLVMGDQSASMAIKDMPGEKKDDPSVSRYEAMRAALLAHKDLFGPEKLGKDRRVVWLGFAGDSYEIKPLDDPAVKPKEPDGQSTGIASSIAEALQRAAGHPISAVVIMTDGQTSQDTGSPLVQRLKLQAVPVFTVPLGSPSGAVDLAVAQVESPGKGFINDMVPVSVLVDRYPSSAAVDPSSIHVKLIDTADGKVLDDKTAPDADPSHPVLLMAQSSTVGAHKWRVEVSYDPPAGKPPELILDNNKRDLAVEMVDTPIKVLYVEGYPRWDYRYLKNLLIREKTFSSSVWLESADRSFVQEGSPNAAITHLPIDAKEFKPYDVIIIGDVSSDYFSPEQMQIIQDQVAIEGAGLLWLAGQYKNPVTYDATPLTPLLPMRQPGLVDLVPSAQMPITFVPTPLAASLSVMRLHAGPGEQDEPNLWPSKLPGLLWAQRMGKLKPAAEVLANGTLEGTSATEPLVVRMRYGAGQSLYVATDDSWRWRYGRGELYFEQFWTQLIRMLGRNRIQQDRQNMRLEVPSHRADFDKPMVVKAMINDSQLAGRDLSNLSVSVSRLEDAQHTPIESIPLSAVTGGGQNGPGGASEGDTTHRFQGTWLPQFSGRLQLRLTGPAVGDREVMQEIEVFRPDDELSQPMPNPELLAKLSKDTGGKVIPLDKLEELAGQIPNRASKTPDDIREPLWNSYLALILVITLLTLEWIGRKIVKLS